MKLTKNDFKGTEKVFRFTLKQLLHNKANIVSLIISALVMLLMVPGITLLNSKTMEKADAIEDNLAPDAPEVIYVVNETDADVPFNMFDEYKNSQIIKVDSFPEDTGEKAGFVKVEYSDEGGYSVKTGGYGKDFLARDAESLIFNTIYGRIDSTKASVLYSPYSVESTSFSDYSGEEDEFSMAGYYIQLIYSIVVMIVSLYAAAYIVQTVVEEKSSKLVESLMISVKPLALILGKILAVMAYVFISLLVFIASGLAGTLLSSRISGGTSVTEMLAGMGISLGDLRLNWMTIVAAVVSLLIGYLTYSLISGLTGAGCSEPEDMQAANSTSMFFIMFCYVAAIVLINFDNPVVNIVMSICPMLSVFCAPVQYMLGGIGLPLLVLSWVIQIGIIVLLAMMCAKVYESLIIYRGKRLGFMDIVKMAVREKSGVKEAK